MEKTLTRRNFVQWGAAAGAAAGVLGLAACAKTEEPAAPAEPEADAPAGSEEPEAPASGSSLSTQDVLQDQDGGQWLTGGCINNCSCGSSRCLLKVYVKDGVPLRVRTDEEDEDTVERMQRRACPRGRASISMQTNPARIKYPMKRKNWSPDNPNGELRGIDEWERISWEEAYDIIASELQKAYDKYGHRSILASGYADIGDTYFDPMICLLNAKGGAMHHDWGTVSMGSWPLVELYMMGGLMNCNDYLSLPDSDLHLHFGNNWMSNKGGNTAYQMMLAKEQGSKFIFVDPWLNQTGQAVADQWVPILPGGDATFVLGMCHYFIENNLQDQAFLDKYCIGFDADHMPEGADPKNNFKDYVLGTYDGQPKTPEWAEKICGVPAETIRDVAQQVADAENVDFFSGQSTTKIPAGEMYAQIFFTFALMKGGLGKPGNMVSWSGMAEGMSSLPYIAAGDSSNGFGLNPANPLTPPTAYVTPMFEAIEDWDAWDKIDYTEGWQSILDGAYGRDSWPGGKKPLDIHVIFNGAYGNYLNQNPNANAAIKAYRKMDFVYGVNPYFDPSRQYSDVVLPCTTWWETSDVAWTNNADTIYWADALMAPCGESKDLWEIASEIATRLGVDPSVVCTMNQADRTYVSLAGCVYRDVEGFKPLLTITQEDIDEIGFDKGGVPQEGKMTLAEFKEKGFYKTEHTKDDGLWPNPWAAYISDPETYPLATASGKFEIYCETLAYRINSVAYNIIDPIGKWQVGDPEQGPTTQTDEFPLLLWTPHSLRRMHSVNDTTTSTREAWPQECFMNVIDAEARGIKNGDIVLMSSPYGQVLRPAKVMANIVPGAVALQDGGWLQIDPETGIDMGGCPNILQAPKASGQGSQSWSGTLCQVEKYTGNLELLPDKNRPVVMPVGVE